MNVYFALAEPNRRFILEQLALHGQLAATEIAEKFELTAPTISQHLKVLFEAGLVLKQKKAQKRVYTINPEGFAELNEWTQNLKLLWEKRLDNLENYLKISN